jgi:hypothetical protein
VAEADVVLERQNRRGAAPLLGGTSSRRSPGRSGGAADPRVPSRLGRAPADMTRRSLSLCAAPSSCKPSGPARGSRLHADPGSRSNAD